MSNATLPAVRLAQAHDNAPALASGAEAITSAIEQLKSLRTFINAEMIEGVDFGTIPGTGTKKTLLLPGAQKTALYFNTSALFTNDKSDLGHGHLEVTSRCQLVSRVSDRAVAEGYGSCSTMESKYRWRKGERVCPHCGKSAIIHGKPEYGGGWICFNKKGGCGVKFREDDPAITSQNTDRVENPDIWDVRNTVLKIAMKRAQVAAALALGAMAELFTQDLEDFYDLATPPQAREPEPEPRPREPRRERRPNALPSPPPAEGTWPEWSSRAVRQAKDVWQTEQAVDLRVPSASRTDLDVNGPRLINHLVTAAVANRGDVGPCVNEDHVNNADGKRDPERARRCAEWLWSNHREWTKGTVGDYLDGKIAEAREHFAGQPVVDQAAPSPDDMDPHDVDYPDEPGMRG